MKKKITSVFLLCVTLFTIVINSGCVRKVDNGYMSNDDFSSQLKNSTDASLASKAFEENTQVFLDRAIKEHGKHPNRTPRKYSKAEFRVALSKVKSIGELETLYKDQGYAQAHQIVANILVQAQRMSIFMDTHPEFKKLPKSRMREVLTNTYSYRKGPVQLFRKTQEAGMGCYGSFNTAINRADEDAMEHAAEAVIAAAAVIALSGGSGTPVSLLGLALALTWISIDQENAMDRAAEDFDSCMSAAGYGSYS